jgi:hypothetical protein
MVTSKTQKLPKRIYDCPKPTDMTILWKALEHFMMVPLVLQFKNCLGKNAFSEFFSKKLYP